MNPEAVLAQLEPLRAPAELSWWPPAPGWWLLALLCLIALLWALLRAWRAWQGRSALRQARRELQQLQRTSLPPGELISRLSVWQRRLVVARSGRRACARLSGQPWIALLNDLAGETSFDETSADLGYRPAVDEDAAQRALGDNQRWLSRLEKRW